MLWVAFELSESIHLWSPLIVLGSVMDTGPAGMRVDFPTCVFPLRGNWGESRTAERTLVMYLEARSHLHMSLVFLSP